jgi:hypothetical protein
VTQEQITRKRDTLLAQLPDARDILRGSLLERNIRHSSGRCKRCDGGGGHAVSVLAIGYPGGRMHQISLRKEQAAHVKQCLENYYSLKAALEEVCELNQKLLRAKPAAAKKKGSGQ